ncbi:MAG TPA: leucine--tRNA ligase [Solirubrobacteraceae bacterium]|nr:leucine--tRNA ligase [Solirubrobacteraceae bacterium]
MSTETTATPALPPYRYTAELANEIEERWRRRWQERGTYLTPNPTGDLAEPNGWLAERRAFYALDMFPYPSGSGLHVGHPLGYIGTDVLARFKRMQGFNVLHTMGYDAFGLPAERYAVDTGQHPEVTTRQNIANMRRQLARLGLGHDRRRSVATADVEFYRWTQWIFLQLFNSWYDPEADAARPVAELVEALDAGRREPPGGGSWADMDGEQRAAVLDGVRLAYLDDVTVNWCPALGTVLANEEVTADGLSEQGNFPVYRRPLRQWMMRITAYADRLLDGLDDLEWSDSLKAMQRNWIGRSEGARVEFEVAGGERISVFTTRPDTLYGVTFVVVAPEHPLLDGDLPAEHADAVAAYRARAARLSDRQREIGAAEEPSGVFTGLEAIHPLTGERVPILTADYVLMQYGSGAVMGVPAGDTRDFAFARALGLPIRPVIRPPAAWFAERGLPPDAPIDDWPDAYTGHGESIGSGGPTDGRPSQEVAREIVRQLEERGTGGAQVAYKLRDWLFSRQRYWGEPIPIVFDERDRPLAVPESQLPIVLPDLEDFAPNVDADESADPVPPLARATDWVEVELDLGDGPKRYRRETNTMPQWAGSCWYYLRYLDPSNDRALVDPEIDRYWMAGSGTAGGVDLYVGGVEHAVLHLLYARFWHKVLYDLGHVGTPEPFQRLFNQGYVQAAAYSDERGFYVEASEVVERDGRWYHDGRPVQRSYGKMGKSLKNSVTPDAIIEGYGADALRLYELFLAPLDQDRPWETQGIVGVSRFLQRVWRAVVDEDTGELRVSDDAPPRELERALHRTADSVRRDIDRLHFNTAISALMELVNELRAAVGDGPTPRVVAEWLVAMLAPFAPHLGEELWERLGHAESVVYAPFPEPDPALVAAEQVSVAIQVNGKLRAVVDVAAGTAKDDLEAAARDQPRIAELLDGAEVRRVVVVPDRLVNFVVG